MTWVYFLFMKVVRGAVELGHYQALVDLTFGAARIFHHNLVHF
jgi:hypothetical protein